MKDEVKEKIISEFVGLKSTKYSFIDADGEEIKKGKGVNKNVVKNTRHNEFVHALFNKKMMRHKRKRIQSKLHRIGTYDVSVSCFDDKKYMLDDAINTFAYFHKDVRSQQNWVKSIESMKSVKPIKAIKSIKAVKSIEQNRKN